MAAQAQASAGQGGGAWGASYAQQGAQLAAYGGAQPMQPMYPGGGGEVHDMGEPVSRRTRAHATASGASQR